ncbi:MAG: tricorn protease, partial [Planctomycetota bacterium]
SWGVEGHGVAPDIEVMDDPALMQDGGDPQLDAAIAQMLEELKTNAYQPPARPEMPDRSGMGLPESDRNQFPEGGDR